MQENLASNNAVRATVNPDLIQFFEIQIAPTADGRVAVSVIATVCENEGELEGMDLGSHRVDTIDEALAVIRRAVNPAH